MQTVQERCRIIYASSSTGYCPHLSFPQSSICTARAIVVRLRSVQVPTSAAVWHIVAASTVHTWTCQVHCKHLVLPSSHGAGRVHGVKRAATSERTLRHSQLQAVCPSRRCASGCLPALASMESFAALSLWHRPASVKRRVRCGQVRVAPAAAGMHTAEGAGGRMQPRHTSWQRLGAPTLGSPPWGTCW